jgi:hypothetical protein
VKGIDTKCSGFMEGVEVEEAGSGKSKAGGREEKNEVPRKQQDGRNSGGCTVSEQARDRQPEEAKGKG